MATITDNAGRTHEVASNSKANAGLATGIIGTSLSGLLALGGLAGLHNMWGNGCHGRNGYGWNDGYNWNSGYVHGMSQANDMSSEDLYIERKQAQNYIDVTKEYYEGRLKNKEELANAFFDAYKRDVDNSFMLYKNQRDGFDILNQKMIDSSFGLYKSQRDGFDILNQKMIDRSFGLYKNQRDEKDELNEKINKLQNKIDVMSAVRPYQDALINAKIDNNALVSDFKLAKRTCRMIEGQLVLPNTPEVTGFTSYNRTTVI